MSRRTVAVGLTRARIVETALALMDEHGVDWLTMRRLAEELDVAAPTLYWHVKNRSELIDAAIDSALGGPGSDLDGEADGDGTWQAQMRAFMYALRERLTAHPSVTDMTRNRYPPSVHRLTVRAVTIVEGMGLPPAETAARARLMIWQVIGFATTENNIKLGTAYHAPLGDDDSRSYSVTPPPEQVDGDAADPRGEVVNEHLAVLDLDEMFNLAVEVFVAGLENDLAARSAVRASSRRRG